MCDCSGQQNQQMQQMQQAQTGGQNAGWPTQSSMGQQYSNAVNQFNNVLNQKFKTKPTGTAPTAGTSGQTGIQAFPGIPGVTSPQGIAGMGTPVWQGTGTAAVPETTPTIISPVPPLNITSLQFLNGALRTQIGKKVNVSFLIGTNTVTDRTGTLLGVGANYIVINETDTDDILFCDFYTIKFVRVYY